MATDTSPNLAQGQTTPPEIPIVESYPFTFTDGKFLCNGVPCVHSAILKKLLLPSECQLSDKERSEWETKAQTTLTTPFVAAQLRHYDIWYPYPEEHNVLRNMLRSRVKFGHCEKVPPRIKKIESELRAEYKPLYTAWKNSVDRWNAEQRALNDAEYHRNATQANERTLSDANFCFTDVASSLGLLDANGPKTKAPEADASKTNIQPQVHAVGQFRVEIGVHSPIDEHSPNQVHSPMQVYTAHESVGLDEQEVHNRDDRVDEQDIGRAVKERYFNNAKAVVIVAIY